MSLDLERQPLLPRSDYSTDDVHDQFCQLVGVPPSDLPPSKRWSPPTRSLYSRALAQRSRQSLSYQMTASVANILLLSQVIIGAAVTGMGAGGSKHIYITLLGAANTIIAGLVAYLKSRGQPMRARMFRDDLDRVVDEIENSEIMWLGISKGVNGYDDIDTEDSVTVRSEVARLTRLYDKAVRNHLLNNPDMYGGGEGASAGATLRNRNVPAQVPVGGPPGPATAPPAPAGGESALPPEQGQPAPVAADPDESPATAKPTAPTAVKVVTPDENAKKDDDNNKKSGDVDKAADPEATNTKQDLDATNGRKRHGANGKEPEASGSTADKGDTEPPAKATETDNAEDDLIKR